MPKGSNPNPQPVAPQQPPSQMPPHDDRGVPQRGPGAPDEPGSVEAPPAREPGPPPTIDEDEEEGSAGVGTEAAHVGATEDQVGDRTGPGVGYDEEER